MEVPITPPPRIKTRMPRSTSRPGWPARAWQGRARSASPVDVLAHSVETAGFAAQEYAMSVEKRPFGPDDLPVSLLGFGCAAVGGLMVRGSAAEQERAVARALEVGINYFDTRPSSTAAAPRRRTWAASYGVSGQTTPSSVPRCTCARPNSPGSQPP